MIKSNALKITLLLTTCSLPLQATLLSTAQIGNAPAHCLMKGDVVKSLSKDKKSVKKSHVLAKNESTTNSIVEIDLGYKTVKATEDQTFFDPLLKKWVKATDITAANHLLAEDLAPIAVVETYRKSGEFKTVKVTVNGSNYLFADGVLTHNFLFFPAIIGFGAWMIFGRKKNGKWVVDVGSKHNKSIRDEHGTK